MRERAHSPILPSTYGVVSVLSVYRESNPCGSEADDYERALVSKAVGALVAERIRAERKRVAEADARNAADQERLERGWRALHAMQEAMGDPGIVRDAEKLANDVTWLRENNAALSSALKWHAAEIERLRGQKKEAPDAVT